MPKVKLRLRLRLRLDLIALEVTCFLVSCLSLSLTHNFLRILLILSQLRIKKFVKNQRQVKLRMLEANRRNRLHLWLAITLFEPKCVVRLIDPPNTTQVDRPSICMPFERQWDYPSAHVSPTGRWKETFNAEKWDFGCEMWRDESLRSWYKFLNY